MKSLLVIASLVLAVHTAVAQPSPELKASVAAWFATPQQVSFVKVSMSEIIDGSAMVVVMKDIRREWPSFASKWQAQLLVIAKTAKETPADRTIVASIREAHKALEDSKTDKAKIDQALRKIKELRTRVGG